jgi:hypothetical protein
MEATKQQSTEPIIMNQTKNRRSLMNPGVHLGVFSQLKLIALMKQ